MIDACSLVQVSHLNGPFLEHLASRWVSLSMFQDICVVVVLVLSPPVPDAPHILRKGGPNGCSQCGIDFPYTTNGSVVNGSE